MELRLLSPREGTRLFVFGMISELALQDGCGSRMSRVS